MIKFKPDSEESRAWIAFMAAAIHDEDAARTSYVADAALEQFRLRVEEPSHLQAWLERGADDLPDDLPDCTTNVHQPHCRHFKLTKEQRTILTSASKVHLFRRKTLLKVVDQLVGFGFLNSMEDGFYEITPVGREALK